MATSEMMQDVPQQPIKLQQQLLQLELSSDDSRQPLTSRTLLQLSSAAALRPPLLGSQPVPSDDVVTRVRSRTFHQSRVPYCLGLFDRSPYRDQATSSTASDRSAACPVRLRKRCAATLCYEYSYAYSSMA